MRNMLFRHWIVALLGIGMLVGQTRQVLACPFCSAVSLTFAQEIAQSQAAAIGGVGRHRPATATLRDWLSLPRLDYLRSFTPFLPATVFFGPLRVRALVRVR